MTLIVRPAVNAEVVEAAAWMAGRGWIRAAGRLLRLWDEGLEAIQDRPRQFPPADDAPPGLDVRNYLLPMYGYRIVYLLLAGDLYVVSFARTSRRAGQWHDRLP